MLYALKDNLVSEDQGDDFIRVQEVKKHNNNFKEEFAKSYMEYNGLEDNIEDQVYIERFQEKVKQRNKLSYL